MLKSLSILAPATLREWGAGYIANWLEVLRNDKRCVVQAASYAQKAVDFLHAMQRTAQPVPAEAGATALFNPKFRTVVM